MPTFMYKIDAFLSDFSQEVVHISVGLGRTKFQELVHKVVLFGYKKSGTICFSFTPHYKWHMKILYKLCTV